MLFRKNLSGGRLVHAVRAVVENLEARQLLCTNPHGLDSHALASLTSSQHVALAVNAGGASFTDAKGQLWSADVGATGGSASQASFPVADTENDLLYSNQRAGQAFQYALPVTTGQYMLRLHFAEPVAQDRQVRVFDVSAENQVILDDLDLYAEGALRAATVREVAINVTDGTLNLAFDASRGNAIVSGIELVYIGAATGTTSGAARLSTASMTSTGPVAAATTATGTTLRVNAGGGAYTDAAGQVWAGNTGFAGGTSSTSAIAIADTIEDPLYYQRRWGADFGYSAPVTNGDYTLRLHFTEPTMTAADRRVFSVTAENRSIISNMDLFAEVGGKRAVVKSFNVSVADGAINLRFMSSKDNAIISAIELIPNVPADATLRVNAGAGAYTDAAGQVWAGNTGFSGGTNSTTAMEVADTTEDPLYYQRRWGADFGYSAAVANGSYTLRLHFVEPTMTAAARRVFSVTAEGQTILSNLDLFAEAGARRAVVKSSDVSVTDGTLNLRFVSTKDNAIISAIELVPLAGPVVPVAPTGLKATSETTTAIRLNWTDASTNETSFVIERRVVGTNAFSIIASPGANTTSYIDANVEKDTSYEYRMAAVNSAGSSPYSDVVLGTPMSEALFTQIEWTNRNSSSPVTRSEALKGVVDGKLYVFGGFSGSAGPIVRSDVYDPTTNSWTRIADLPARITHVGVAVAGRDIYFAGAYTGLKETGYDQSFATRNVWKYNVDTNTFTSVTPLPLARGSGALVYVNNELHFFGGVDSSRQDRGEHWVMKLDGSNTWVAKAANSDPRSHMGYAALDGKVYAIGGQHNTDANLTTRTTMQSYDPATDKWTDLKGMPRGISHIGSSTFAMGSRIIVVGGEYGHLKGVADVLAYDPKRNEWTSLTPLPATNNSTVADVIDGYIYNTTGSRQTTYVGKPVG